MPSSILHPQVRSAAEKLGILEATEAQKAAFEPILRGKNVLLIAPTGMGKTEAAMLPVFSKLVEDKRRIGVIYVTPLRALNRDMLKRLREFGKELDIRISVRHGDTTQKERRMHIKEPPNVMITTPETLQIMLIGSKLRELLKNVRYVIVDEIHELADNERGAQLSVVLERLVEVAGEFQRIGLSATVGDPEEIGKFLVGKGRDVKIVDVSRIRKMEIDVEMPLPDEEDEKVAAVLSSEPEWAACLRRGRAIIDESEASLFFVNTRETGEKLALQYSMLGYEDIELHHGSLAKDVRIEVENRFKNGELKALICTSSLELGIDVGRVDRVIQFNSPRSVSRMVQRVGRSGHSMEKMPKGTVIAVNEDEFAEGAVIAEKAVKGEVESKTVRKNPLSVLANQITSIVVERRDVSADEIYSLVKRAHPFTELEREEFDSVVNQLVEIRQIWRSGERLSRGRNSRKYFYDNISMISDERSYWVVDIGTRKRVAKLDEKFVAAYIEPFSIFIVRGKAWRVVDMDEESILAEPVGDLGSIPSWSGEDLPVPFEVAREVGRLRRIRDFSHYSVRKEDAGRYIKWLEDAEKGGAIVATDRRLVIEEGDGIVINACFGTNVNLTLSHLLSTLLSARYGASINTGTDPYRIMIQAAFPLGGRDIIATLDRIKPDTLEALLRIVLKNSEPFKWRFLYSAKKFGIITKGADMRSIRIDRLIELYRGTPVFEEAMRMTLWKDMDMDNTRRILDMIKSGEIEVVRARLSEIGRMGLRQKGGAVLPSKPSMEILKSVKKRIERTEIRLICLNCGNIWRSAVSDVHDGMQCNRCGGSMVAMIRPYQKEFQETIKKKNPGPEELKRIRWLVKSAEIIKYHGHDGAMLLAGRGIGPDTANRILSRYHRDEWELLGDILEAEINYAKTKRFWD